MHNEHESKISELGEYFNKSMVEVSVHADWDSDRRCASFRFDGEKRNKLVKLSVEVLEDNTTANIVRKLEAAKWHEVLEGLPVDTMAVFTKTGFRMEQFVGV